ncbi:hypothetical protein LUZ60_015995 [Juncus effusus]|nr:hypothetical protein LUZ60_015995 [Juncus effusus]
MQRHSSLALLLLLLAWPLLSTAAQLGGTCKANSDCGTGQRCTTCGPSSSSICSRSMPTDPESLGTGLPFNKYSWLTTHNSFAITGEPSATGASLITFTNQEDSVTSQLQNGVRGLMLDMYDFENDVWLCHSFGGNCYNYTAFQPAINTLKEIKTFMDANKNEVITIFIEDYTATGDLPKLFNNSGLMDYWFPVSEMPKSGGDWPLLKDMIANNTRLIVFTSKSAKEKADGVAYEWNYVVENQYGNAGMTAGTCPNRAESDPMDTKTKSLVLMNFFPDNPNPSFACANNSAPLVSMLDTCHNLSADRWANYIAVDFYMRSDGGGAPLATDMANGHLVCGCDNIAFCKANSTYGTCIIPPPPPPSPPPPPQKSSPSNNDNAASEFSSNRGILVLQFLLLSLLFLR